MHRIDGDAAYPAGHFSEGDPLIPRLPTQVTAEWLEDVQEELVSIVTAAGLSLVKGSAQLGAAVANLGVAQTFTALKTFSAGLSAAASTFTGLLTAQAGFASQAASSVVNSAVGTPTLTLTNSGGGGARALDITAGLLSGTTATFGSTVSAVKGLFGAGLAAPLNIGSPLAAPSTGTTGDTMVVFDSGTTYLYHCDSGPSSWSRVAMTRLY